MGNTQEPQSSAPKSDHPKQEEKGNEKSTQTDNGDQHSDPNETTNVPEPDNNAANGDIGEVFNDQPDPDIPEQPPPYTRHGEESSDDTRVKSDLSSEPKKKPLDEETLDDLKLTIEKRFIDCNDRLESLEESFKKNIEQQKIASNTLLDLKDTVYAHFGTSNKDGTSTTEKEDSSGHEQFTERIGKHVVEHLLKNEQFKDLIHRDEEAAGETVNHEDTKEIDDSIVCQPEKESIDNGKIVASNGRSIPVMHSLKSGGQNESLGQDRRTFDIHMNVEDKASPYGDIPIKYKINSTAWELCMEEENLVDTTMKLLIEGSLPVKQMLNKLCDRLGRSSLDFNVICESICKYIKAQSSQIVDVWAAYRFDNISCQTQNDIIFVVIKKTPEVIDIEYETYQRCVEEISEQCENENNRLQREENKVELDPHNPQIEGVTNCLKNNSKKLMKKHSNLTRVTISGIKSSGFGNKNGSLKQLPCIAVYVQIKGLIPIREEPFEEYIDEYPVDVREGVLTLLGSSTDLHQNIRMGCALDSGFGSDQGTVGPFFRFESDNQIYLLTCAHVLLNPNQMRTLVKREKMNYGSCGNDAYQPPESTTAVHGTRNHLGKIELAIYKEGNDNVSGMEIVLVKVDEDRIPIDGKFPDSDSYQNFGTDEPFEFPIERICDLSNSSSTDVYKFGAFTGLQKGRLRVQGSSVRASMLTDNVMGFSFVLDKQIEIEDVDNKIFAVKGDSGSLVLKQENGHLAAVGILEGKMGNHYMVTPICDIKHALSEMLSSYKDPPSGEEMDIEENFCGMAITLNYVTRNVSTIQQTGLSSDISDEIARQNASLQTQIGQSTDHKIQSVKTELSAIKQHIDTTKNEIKIDIQQMENRVTENISNQIQRLFTELKSHGQA